MPGTVAPSTLALHLAALDRLAEQLGGDRPLHRIASRDIERFRAKRLEAGLSPASANRELRTLKRVFNLAILRGYLADGANPCLALPMKRVARKRPPYCSPEAFQAICEVAPDTLWQAFLVTLYTTGLRLREAMNLTWHDVDFQAGQLHVTRKTARGYVQAWQPKDHEMRSVPLPDRAVTLLTAWETAAPEGCPYVFMEHGRWAYYRERVDRKLWRKGQDLVNNLLRRFKTLCRHAGVGPYTLHDLRRSCITNWARQLPVHVVQELAGHSDIQTTQRYYLSVHAEDLARARRVQDDLVDGIPKPASTDTKLTHRRQSRSFPPTKGARRKS
jgi:integrase